MPAHFFIMDCIVIGNGESLNKTPLDELAKRYDTFGCNRIHLLPFKPTYYVRVEPPAWDGTAKQFFDECRIHIANGENCIFPDWEDELGQHPNVTYIKTCHHYKYPHTHKKFPTEWHMPYICDTNAVTTMMQVAVLKGYTRIFLVGCDLDGEHFSKDDNGKVEYERLIAVHTAAAKSSPVPIYNATIGGRLEIYPRIDTERLINAKEEIPSYKKHD